MIIQLTDVPSCHGSRVIETKVLRPPAHTCVTGQPAGSVQHLHVCVCALAWSVHTHMCAVEGQDALAERPEPMR